MANKTCDHPNANQVILCHNPLKFTDTVFKIFQAMMPLGSHLSTVEAEKQKLKLNDCDRKMPGCEKNYQLFNRSSKKVNRKLLN